MSHPGNLTSEKSILTWKTLVKSPLFKFPHKLQGHTAPKRVSFTTRSLILQLGGDPGVFQSVAGFMNPMSPLLPLGNISIRRKQIYSVYKLGCA